VTPRFTRGPLAEEGGSEASSTGEPLVSTRTAFWISDVLSDSHAREYAFGRDSSLDFPFAVAAKTGTSQAYRDNWAIGYTRAVTVGVWVGNFDRTPLVGSSGVTGAGPIFHAVMSAAVQRMFGTLPLHGDPPTVATADGLERRTICAVSGKAATASCPSHVEEWLPSGAEVPPCDWHVDGHLQWPQPYRAWARDQGFAVSPVPDGPAGREHGGIVIVNPPEGAIYSIDPTLRASFQTLGLRASSDAGGRLIWSVDGREVGRSDVDARFEWIITPGAHIISVRDVKGRRAQTRVVVK
jgi:penicillin-binding protein 1C